MSEDSLPSVDDIAKDLEDEDKAARARLEQARQKVKAEAQPQTSDSPVSGPGFVIYTSHDARQARESSLLNQGRYRTRNEELEENLGALADYKRGELFHDRTTTEESREYVQGELAAFADLKSAMKNFNRGESRTMSFLKDAFKVVIAGGAIAFLFLLVLDRAAFLPYEDGASAWMANPINDGWLLALIVVFVVLAAYLRRRR
ncbi:MAG: hypothetical protein JRM77_07050 [Nitrososphaerota archaeon]|nr:hypothetical protein [Nitrososphaerota archaeon]